MSIGIIGHGFVGKAVESGFERYNEIIVVDPVESELTIYDLIFDHMPKFIFICVPTPMSATGECNTRIAKTVINELDVAVNKCGYNPLIVIKSTVPPDFLRSLPTSISIISNPEFLTQNNWKEDFVNPFMQLYGGDQIETNRLANLYRLKSTVKKCKEVHTDMVTASLIKYTLNSFLATKVTFMNHMHDILAASDTDTSYEEFAAIIANDDRVGSTHLQVPGPDGKRGYGGACFPKDTSALLLYCKSLVIDFDLLAASIADNEKFRNEE